MDFDILGHLKLVEENSMTYYGSTLMF